MDIVKDLRPFPEVAKDAIGFTGGIAGAGSRQTGIRGYAGKFLCKGWISSNVSNSMK